MPYINRERRDALEPLVEELSKKLTDPQFRAGDLNYVITNLLLRSTKQGMNYRWHNENLGVLDAVAREYYRRKIAPYEDKAIKKNGDIEVYS